MFMFTGRVRMTVAACALNSCDGRQSQVEIKSDRDYETRHVGITHKYSVSTGMSRAIQLLVQSDNSISSHTHARTLARARARTHTHTRAHQCTQKSQKTNPKRRLQNVVPAVEQRSNWAHSVALFSVD
jgi:hypothetical protein